MTTGSRRLHDVCWLNLMTPAAAQAKEFFAALLGWTYAPMDDAPGGTLILVEGKHAGALMDLDAGVLPPGTPPAIGVMVKVERAEATVERAKALGGGGGPVFDVLENGRMGMITDPSGAVLGLWQPKSKDGFDCDSHAHGAPTWFEVLSADAAPAVAFYTRLFGWTVEQQSPVPGMKYELFALAGVPVAGAMSLPGVPAHWSTSFAVKDADDVVARARALGGEVCIPVNAIPGVGRFALLKSPQGVSFHVMEYAPGAARR